MQQPICQPEQISGQQQQGQQVNQQMMLCPVRVVYETQILMPQTGDQIQPNQTYFINPQNPPPWAQNRPVQNQVIYFQQLPQNIMQHLPQNIDQNVQNQLYLQQNMQNYAYQQMMPQFLAQNTQEQIRTVQMIPNMMAQNIMQNQNVQQVQTNVSLQNERMVQNVPNPNINNDRVIPQANYAQPQTQSLQAQNPVLLNAINNGSRQVTPQNIPTQKATEIQRQYRPVITQMRPQISMQMPLQNMQQITQNIAQTFVQNIPQRSMQMNVANVQPTQPANLPPMPRKPPDVKIPAQTVARNPTYTYRPIQPRPQLRSNNPYSVINVQNQLIQRQNMPNQPNTIFNNGNMTVVQHPVVPTVVKTEEAPPCNRKRKSESPDEIQKKMATLSKSDVSAKLQEHLIARNVTSEIGVNTSPVRRPNIPHTVVSQPNQMVPNLSMPILNPQPQIKEEPRAEKTQLMQTETNVVHVKSKSKDASQQTEKDKLVRNTVYKQATGRILSDKETKPLLPETKNVKVENNVKVESVHTIDANKMEVDVPEVPKDNTTDKQLKDEKPLEIKEVKGIPQTISKPTEVKAETKPEIPKEVKKVHEEARKANDEAKKVHDEAKKIHDEVKKVNEEVKTEKEEKHKVKKVKEEKVNDKKDYKNISIDDIKGNEIHIVDGSIRKEERDFILTHVLDGFVIQESNIAFPIRKPLKEKTLPNTQSMLNQSKDLKSDSDCKIKDNSKILDLSLLQLNEGKIQLKNEKADEKETDDNKDNPFGQLKTNVVKTWTVDQLSSHLSQYNWEETISILREHEIDGESLFLVSKPQLMHIGVSETHAEVICEFVKS